MKARTIAVAGVALVTLALGGAPGTRRDAGVGADP